MQYIYVYTIEHNWFCEQSNNIQNQLNIHLPQHILYAAEFGNWSKLLDCKGMMNSEYGIR